MELTQRLHSLAVVQGSVASRPLGAQGWGWGHRTGDRARGGCRGGRARVGGGGTTSLLDGRPPEKLREHRAFIREPPTSAWPRMARNWGGHNMAAQVRLAPGLLWGQHLSWAWSGQATVGEGAVGGVPGGLGPSHPADQAGGPVTLGEMKQEEPQGKGPEGVAERTPGAWPHRPLTASAGVPAAATDFLCALGPSPQQGAGGPLPPTHPTTSLNPGAGPG